MNQQKSEKSKGKFKRTRERPYFCFFCFENFEYKAEFLRHRREGHKSDKIGAERTYDEQNLTCIIKVNVDENFKVKEKICRVQGSSARKDGEPTSDKKYQLKECTVDIRKDEELNASKVGQVRKQSKIQESEKQLEKEYKNDKCDDNFEYKVDFLNYSKEDRNPQPTGDKIGAKRNSDDKNLFCMIEYDQDETLEIKEEIVQDPGISSNEVTGQERDKKTELKFCNVDIKEDISSLHNKVRTQKKQKIQESKRDSKKYKCEKCARSYSWKSAWYKHIKYECGVMRKFRCILCNKKFKRKAHMNTHINSVHLKSNSKASLMKHNCDKCTRSYTLAKNLFRHKRLEHSSVKPQFTCDICGHTAKEKVVLSKHISTQHLK